MFFLLQVETGLEAARQLSNPEIWLGALLVFLGALNYLQWKGKKEADKIFEDKLEKERARNDLKDEKLFEIATRTSTTLQEFSSVLVTFQSQSNEKDAEVLRIVSALNSGVSELAAVIKVILSLKNE